MPGARGNAQQTALGPRSRDRRLDDLLNDLTNNEPRVADSGGSLFKAEHIWRYCSAGSKRLQAMRCDHVLSNFKILYWMFIVTLEARSVLNAYTDTYTGYEAVIAYAVKVSITVLAGVSIPLSLMHLIFKWVWGHPEEEDELSSKVFNECLEQIGSKEDNVGAAHDPAFQDVVRSKDSVAKAKRDLDRLIALLSDRGAVENSRRVLAAFLLRWARVTKRRNSYMHDPVWNVLEGFSAVLFLVSGMALVAVNVVLSQWQRTSQTNMGLSAFVWSIRGTAYFWCWGLSLAVGLLGGLILIIWDQFRRYDTGPAEVILSCRKLEFEAYQVLQPPAAPGSATTSLAAQTPPIATPSAAAARRHTAAAGLEQ